MNDLTIRVAQTVGRHFVTLSCVQRLPANLSEKILVFSGFVVDIAGEWFYVTAGHILKDIRLALAAGATFDVWRLDDQTAGNRFNGVAVPYSFDLVDWVVLEDAETALDYAAVHLGGLYRRQLAVGGVAAIANNARSDHVTDHDQWALVGIPSESVAYDGKTVITARVVVAPLIPTDEPALAHDKAQNQFYAKLAEGYERVLNDIDGMSGGPIFTLKKVDGTWMYGVIGVQSGWYRTSKTLAACPFSSFGQALEKVVKEAKSIHVQSGDAQSAT